MGGNCSVMERDSFDERPYTMPFFPPYSNIFFQNRVFDWQLQHLGREFELNFVPGRGGNLKELILKSSNAGERGGGGESQCGGC